MVDETPERTFKKIIKTSGIRQKYDQMTMTKELIEKIDKNLTKGSEIPKKEDCPPFEEVLSYFKEVHEKAITHISQLTDNDLAKPTTNGIDFGGEDSIRAIIKHSIRHEGVHTGHLSWLCKLFGLKTL